jgi:hypothetical protein
MRLKHDQTVNVFGWKRSYARFPLFILLDIVMLSMAVTPLIIARRDSIGWVFVPVIFGSFWVFVLIVDVVAYCRAVTDCIHCQPKTDSNRTETGQSIGQ